MSSGSFRQVDVKCPFYRTDIGRKVICESPIPGSSLSLFFKTKQEFEQQMDIFCCEYYDKCEIYRSVMEAKYD